MKLKESEEEDEDLDEEIDETEETEEVEKAEPEASSEGEDEVEETAPAPETDNVGDPSVEIDVEELIHEIEAEGEASRPGRELAAKRRLEELMERKRSKRELEDFDDYEV